ncbi:MAG: hypothetical protein JWQ07_1113 [Ramlibacter sp.]|nr:hypothetical protein [Ramlibacter sp.]
MPEHLRLEELRPGVTLLRLNRPGVLNALTDQMVSGLHAAMELENRTQMLARTTGGLAAQQFSSTRKT